MRQVHPNDTSYRRYIKFYAPKARGEFDFRLFDEMPPGDDLMGPDGFPVDSEHGGAGHFMLMGWSSPIRVEVQGRDLAPVLQRCAEFLREAGSRLIKSTNASL